MKSRSFIIVKELVIVTYHICQYNKYTYIYIYMQERDIIYKSNLIFLN